MKQYPDHLILTKLEMEKPGSILDLLQDASPLGDTFALHDSYIMLSSILMASAHCASDKGILRLNPALEPVLDTKNRLVGADTEDLGIGVSSSINPIPDPTSLKDIKNKPAGSLPSLLFWTPQQSNFLSNSVPRSILTGSYGTGKTIILIEKMNRLIQTAVKYNDDNPDQQKEIKGLFISCLDPSDTECYDAEGDFVPPIYDILMKKYCLTITEQLKDKKVTVNFFNAFDICNKMGGPLTVENFYSKLPAFIEKGNKYPSFLNTVDF